MEILKPIVEPGPFLRHYRKKPDESGQPQALDDKPQQLGKLMGRQNASYEPVWEAVKAAYPKWQPVKCNSYRRALLLASAAIQHRTLAIDVQRRGRMLCLKLIPAKKIEGRPPIWREDRVPA